MHYRVILFLLALVGMGTGQLPPLLMDLLSQIPASNLDEAYNKLGKLQCGGLTLYEIISELIYGPPGVSFGGKTACDASCEGNCTPLEKIFGDAPVSLYPWACTGCKRCNENGPYLTDKWKVPGFALGCKVNKKCDDYCKKIDPNSKGYICNWWYPSPDNMTPIGLLFYPPKFSPIRWCACCPINT